MTPVPTLEPRGPRPLNPAERGDAAPDEPVALHDHAMANLRYIRATIDRAGAFTAVPGWGGVAMGLVGLLAAVVAHQQATVGRWVGVWVAAAVVAVAVGSVAMARKARRAGTSLFSGPGRKFALGLVPPFVAGGILSVVLYSAGLVEYLPGVWLLLYGCGVVTGGAFSVPPVPVMGLAFMCVGTVALLVAPAAADLLLGVGFGGLHLAFGALIASRYGG